MTPFVLTLLGFLLASLGQVLLSRREGEAVAVALLSAATGLVLIAFRGLPSDEVKEQQLPISRWGRRGVLVLLVASLPAWLAGWLLAVRWDSLFSGLVLYAVSLTLVGAVVAWREGWRLPRLHTVRDHWVELALVGLVLALGLFLRLHQLDYYPPPGGISWNDEAQIGKDAYGVLFHYARPWQFPFSVYTACLSFLLLGPTVLALRLTFVVLGFATLVVFYLLAKELFRFPVALAATFLFAVSRWHIAFSRLVLPSTPAMLLEVSTFYLLLRGRRTWGLMNYVLAGVTMGLGLYSHASFRIVPLLVLLLGLSEAWSWWRTRRAAAGRTGRELLGRWLCFLGSCVVFTLPLAALVSREPQAAFGERFSSIMPALFGVGGTFQMEAQLERVRRVVGFFNYKGEAWGAVNVPDLPMLDPWTGILFLLGFGYCLFYFWKNKHLFYLSWLVLTVLAGGVLTVDLRSHRFAGVMPVLFLFAGVFLERSWAAFQRSFGVARRGYFAVLLLPVLVLAGYANYFVFFQRQIHAGSVRIEFTREISSVANYVSSLGDGRYVYLFANYPYYSPGMDFAWMAKENPGERRVDVLDVIPSHREAGGEELVYIFVTPYDVQALAELVVYHYPQAQLRTFQGEYGRYTFVAAHVPAEEARRAQGLSGHYYSGHDLEAEPVAVRSDEKLSFDWRVNQAPLAFPFSAEWRGTIFAPEAGRYLVETEPDGLCGTRVDEQPLGEGEERRLAKGWHKLRVTCVGLEEGAGVWLKWTAPGRVREVIPAEFLSPREEVNGVQVSVFEGPDWSGDPVEQSIQPSLSLLRMPTIWQSGFTRGLAGAMYSLDCSGQLMAQEPGSYLFEVEPWNGKVTLYVDGVEVVTAEGAKTTSNSGQLGLEAGWHDLWLRYAYGGGEFSGVQVFYTPPGGRRQSIPTELMIPVDGSPSRPGD
jgi:hypothetical protein